MSLSSPASHYAHRDGIVSSNTNQDLHLWSTTPDINLWPAMIARDREANRIEKIDPHARVMTPNDGFRESIFDVTQVYCQVLRYSGELSICLCWMWCLWRYAVSTLGKVLRLSILPSMLSQGRCRVCVVSGRSTQRSMAQQSGTADSQVEIESD